MEGPVRAPSTYRNVRWLFLANAVINWTLSLPGIIDPSAAAAAFGGAPPHYPSIIRLWQGFVFMFGCMFWEVSRDVDGKAALIKYNWIEKTITATAITLGYTLGDIPQRLMVLIVCTNWLWIPFIIWADIAVSRMRRKESPLGEAQP
jgi:hypothetical protein